MSDLESEILLDLIVEAIKQWEAGFVPTSLVRDDVSGMISYTTVEYCAFVVMVRLDGTEILESVDDGLGVTDLHYDNLEDYIVHLKGEDVFIEQPDPTLEASLWDL